MHGNKDNLERRLEQAEAALLRCNKLTVASQYAGAMMHEVNNPLEAISNLVYLIKLDASDSAKVLEYANVIEEQLSIVSGISRQVLSFHREQASAKDFDIVDLMESALKLHQARINKGGITLIRDFRQPAVASIFGAEILQVISNLLLNALDALPERDALLKIRVKARKDSVHITVADNGLGMHPDILKHLFEPYRTTKTDGTGLGLWFSKRIVEKHKGKMRVRSSQTVGRTGTTFRLSLPTQYAA